MFAPSSIASIPSGLSDFCDEASGTSVCQNSALRSSARVLIPARNEAATIGLVVRGCGQAGFAVTVIDDSSTDDTAFLARQAGAEVLTLRGPHHGKTAALHQALLRLPDSVDWLFFLDGDGQHDPADIDRFWQAREQADLIVGNRFPDAARMPFLRRWTNRTMSAVLRRSGICDSQCGFRLVRRAWLGSWLPIGHHFQFETEMALLAAAQSSRVINLPIPATYALEESKIVPWRDAVNFAHCLLRHRSAPAMAPLSSPHEQSA
jgi:glycosyltransferase involved in cell wall biosynthesis